MRHREGTANDAPVQAVRTQVGAEDREPGAVSEMPHTLLEEKGVKMKKIVAFETGKKGKAVRVVNSAGLDYVGGDSFDILRAVVDSKDPGALHVVWDSAEFWEPIFKLLPPSAVSALEEGKPAVIGGMKGLRLWWGITRWGRWIGIRYNLREQIKGNFYSESKGEIEIYELKQYYDEAEGGDDIASTVALGEKLLATLARMGMNPNTLVSAISVYKECVLDKIDIPTYTNMPGESLDCHDYAFNTTEQWDAKYKASIPGRQVYAYDLTSAYGAALAELPNLKYARFVYSEEIPPPGFYWGVLRGVIHNKREVSPIVNPETKRTDVRHYSEGFIPVDLYGCVMKWGIVDVEVKDGWYIYLDKYYKLFDYSMRRLYALRNEDELQNSLAKTMAVATWGKTLEIYDKGYGELFNPIYGSMVVNAVKVKLTDFIYSHGLQDSVYSVRVDGVRSPCDIDITTERRFGEFRKVKEGAV